MKSSRKKDIIKAVNKVAYPSKILSLFYLEEDFGAYFVNNVYLSISVALGAVFTSLFIYFLFDKPDVNEHLLMSNEMDYFEMFLMLSIPIFSMYNLTFYLDFFNESLEVLQEVYDTLELIGRKTQFPRSNLWVFFLFLSGAFVFRMIKSNLNGLMTIESFVELVYYIILTSQIIVLVHRFCGLVAISRNLFASCCKELRRPRISNSTLESLISAHHKLCVHTLIISGTEMPHVVLVILMSFVLFVSEGYKCLAMCLIVGVFDVIVILIKLSWVGIGFSLILWIVKECTNCSRKVSHKKYFFNSTLSLV